MGDYASLLGVIYSSPLFLLTYYHVATVCAKQCEIDVFYNSILIYSELIMCMIVRHRRACELICDLNRAVPPVNDCICR